MRSNHSEQVIILIHQLSAVIEDEEHTQTHQDHKINKLLQAEQVTTL